MVSWSCFGPALPGVLEVGAPDGLGCVPLLQAVSQITLDLRETSMSHWDLRSL